MFLIVKSINELLLKVKHYVDLVEEINNWWGLWWKIIVEKATEVLSFTKLIVIIFLTKPVVDFFYHSKGVLGIIVPKTNLIGFLTLVFLGAVTVVLIIIIELEPILRVIAVGLIVEMEDLGNFLQPVYAKEGETAMLTKGIDSGTFMMAITVTMSR